MSKCVLCVCFVLIRSVGAHQNGNTSSYKMALTLKVCCVELLANISRLRPDPRRISSFKQTGKILNYFCWVILEVCLPKPEVYQNLNRALLLRRCPNITDIILFKLLIDLNNCVQYDEQLFSYYKNSGWSVFIMNCFHFPPTLI